MPIYPVTLEANDLGDNPLAVFGTEYLGQIYRWEVDSQVDVNPLTWGRLRTYRSADAGVTWTELDSANAPDAKPRAAGGGGYSVIAAVQDGTVVRFVWVRYAGPPTPSITGLTRCTFSLATNAWGAQTDFAAPADMDFASAAHPAIDLAARGAGDYVLTYSSTQSAGAGRLSYAPYDGTTLGAGVALPAQTGACLLVGTVASGGITQIVYTSGTALKSIGLDASNAFGTTQTIALNMHNPSFKQSTPIAYEGKFAVAAERGFGTVEVHVYTATVALDPAWADSLVISSLNANIMPYFYGGNYIPRALALGAVNGTLAIAWPTKDTSGDNDKWGYRGATADTATLTWTVPAQLWDAEIIPANKPTEATQVAMCPLPSFGIGLLAVSQYYFDPPTARVSDVNQFYLFPVASPAPTIECGNPPDGIVGTPYSHTFPVTGGTPPYSYAITAGAPPPGLTLDGATGDLSGTPTTAGVYPFTVQVTDDADQTGDVDCSITIDGGPVHLRITLLGVKRYPELPKSTGKIEEPPKVRPKKVKGPGFPGGGVAL